MRPGSMLLVFLVGCSSAGELPSGGPHGGGAYDASPADAAPIVFFSLDAGLGSSGGSTGATGTTGTSSSVPTTTGSTSGPSATTTTTTTTQASVSSSSSSAPSGKTWTYLFTTYLTDATATIGSCDGSCHYHSECDTASDCYSWIGAPSSQARWGALSNGGGLFSWDMGYMPRGGPTSEPQAEADFASWIAAGSPND